MSKGMIVTRRTAIVSAAALGLCAAGGFVFRPDEHGKRQFVRAIVRRDLHYLTIAPDVMDHFVEDFLANEDIPTIRSIDHAVGVFSTVASVIIPEDYERYRRKLATKFLLATDFFANGANPKIPVAYVTYPDPYKAPCYNPLRDFHG
jgi:hypothetical protein